MKAKKITDFIFERIKHGDEKHQDWLHDELRRLWPELTNIIAGPDNISESDVSHAWYDIDMVDDPPE